jgi:hypothetical protein
MIVRGGTGFQLSACALLLWEQAKSLFHRLETRWALPEDERGR